MDHNLKIRLCIFFCILPFLVSMNRLSLLNEIELTPILGFGLSRSGLMAAICRLPLNISYLLGLL